MKKSSVPKDRKFFQPTAVADAPSIAATTPEAEVLRKQGKEVVGPGGARKKTGLSSESTARSYSGKSAAKEMEGLKEADMVPAKKAIIVKPVQPRGQKSEDRMHGTVHNSSSSSSIKSDNKSQRAQILSKKKKKSKLVASSRDEASSIEVAQAKDTAAPARHRHAERMLEFAKRCNHVTIEELTEEFNGLPDPKKETCKAFLDPQNTDKNRYYNVYCLDKTRVVLRPFSPNDGTYIHANRVIYETLKHTFVITQGPLYRTVNDFWRMIWQDRSEYIVMLCQVTEDGKKKTAEYLPNQLGDVGQYGAIKVKTCMRDSDNGLITTRLTLQYKQDERVVVHYQMTEWRDCRAPVNCVRQLFNVLKTIRGSDQSTVVHCSAGIGRSGTLVALEMLMMDLANLKPLDVEKVVQILRIQRCHAVQTFEQYISIYRFLLLFGEQNGLIQQADSANFTRVFEEFTRGMQ